MSGLEARANRRNAPKMSAQKERSPISNSVHRVASEIGQIARVVTLLPEAAVVFSVAGLSLNREKGLRKKKLEDRKAAKELAKEQKIPRVYNSSGENKEKAT